jgi:hypothetical protein
MANMADILKRARQPIMSLMTGTCDVQEYQSVKDQDTHVTKQQLVTVYSGQPCKLSYSKNPATAEGDAPGSLLTVRLLLPSELAIRAGAVITVTQAGKTRTFKAASEPAVYTNHQEVELESAKDYA